MVRKIMFVEKNVLWLKVTNYLQINLSIYEITNNVATDDSKRLKKMQRVKIIKTILEKKTFPHSFEDIIIRLLQINQSKIASGISWWTIEKMETGETDP